VCRLRLDTVSDAGPAIVGLLALLSVPDRLPIVGSLLTSCAPIRETAGREPSLSKGLTGEEYPSASGVTSSSNELLDSSYCSDIDSVIRSLLALCVAGRDSASRIPA
jgi:hypothetical protein